MTAISHLSLNFPLYLLYLEAESEGQEASEHQSIQATNISRHFAENRDRLCLKENIFWEKKKVELLCRTSEVRPQQLYPLPWRYVQWFSYKVKDKLLCCFPGSLGEIQILVITSFAKNDTQHCWLRPNLR